MQPWKYWCYSFKGNTKEVGSWKGYQPNYLPIYLLATDVSWSMLIMEKKWVNKKIKAWMIYVSTLHYHWNAQNPLRTHLTESESPNPYSIPGNPPWLSPYYFFQFTYHNSSVLALLLLYWLPYSLEQPGMPSFKDHISFIQSSLPTSVPMLTCVRF